MFDSQALVELGVFTNLSLLFILRFTHSFSLLHILSLYIYLHTLLYIICLLFLLS